MLISPDHSVAIRWLMVAFAALLAIASFLAAFNHHNSTTHRIVVAPSSTRRRKRQIQSLGCNGILSLCDKRANEILYATAHNANADLENGRLFFPNHKKELERALQAGFRGLNMDISLCDGVVTLIHISCLLDTRNLNTVLTNIVEFMDENPNEVLILPTQLEGDVTLAQINATFQSVPGWSELLYDHPGPGTAWPTLQELIQAGTRVLFFHYNRQPCSEVICPQGFHDWFVYAAETRFSFVTVSSLKNKVKACEITRGGGGTRDFFGVNAFVTPATRPKARQVNDEKFLSNHIEACSERNNLNVSLVLVDFWKAGDVIHVVNEHNLKL